MYPINTTYRCDERLCITDVSWERIFLNITIVSNYDEPVKFSLGRVLFNRGKVVVDDFEEGETRELVEVLKEIPLSACDTERNIYKFRLNMSVMDDRDFLDNGRWIFTGRIEDVDELIICSGTYDISYKLPEMDRIFPYGKGRYSYNVHFSRRCTDSVHIIPTIDSRFMIENTDWKNRYNVKERKTRRGRYRCRKKKFKIWLMNFVYHMIANHTPKDGSRVLFMSETKPYLWGNLKYIDERLKARGLDKQLQLSYTFRVAVGKHNSMLSWYKTIRLIAQQDFIFVDDYVPIFGFINLIDKTKLIQVWHAGEGFKAVGYGRFGRGSSPFPINNCHKKYDYAITGSKRLVKVYSEVFGIPEENVLPLGMARLDGFLDSETIDQKTAEFYAAHPECVGKKLILFSPTFRGPNQRRAHYKYAMINMDEIYNFCGDEYIWAFKMHPFIRSHPPIPEEYADRIIDLSDYQNINDIYYVTDIMITDYSSAYFEFSIFKRPILFYTYDREVYELTRGVHKSIKDTAPGKICDTFDALMTALRNEDFDIEKTIKFSDDNFGEYDGHAADKIIDTIILGQ